MTRLPLLPALIGALSLVPCAQDTSREGWIALFDGKSLAGWTAKIVGHEAGVDFAETFRVRDGLLEVVYDGYKSFDGRFGHLFHDVPCKDYRLRVEYRFVGEQVPGGPEWAWRNSGVMIHGQSAQSMRKDQDFPVSIEVQLLGGDGTHERHTANLCTPGTNVVMQGELVTRHCTDSTSSTFHGDGWVTVEIEVHGSALVRHWVDGKIVLEYAAPQLDERDADARAMLEAGAPKLLDHGTVSLQSESHPIQFRKVELLPL
jgi:hypothetical protein